MKPLNTLSIALEYSVCEEEALNPTIALIEDSLGASRSPYGGRAGAIDLVTYLCLAFSFTAGAAATTILGKYFEGLLSADKAQSLGKKHRDTISQWLDSLTADLRTMLARLHPALRDHTRHLRFEDKEQALAITFTVRRTSCFIVLNHEVMNEALLDNLPAGIANMINYLALGDIPEDAHCAQLYFDPETARWKYILLPTTQGYGKWIDRYYDIESETIEMIPSKAAFEIKFRPLRQDELKFLVSPFR